MSRDYNGSARRSIPTLRTIRRHHGLSQTALGNRAGLSQARVSLLERGVYASAQEIETLAAALEVPVERLLDLGVIEAIDRAIGTSVGATVATDGC